MASKTELEALLQERNEHPERLHEIDGRIHEAFDQTVAIFALDMSGFSRLTMRYGIVHFLAMIHRLHSIAAPIIQQHGGSVVKNDADNIFATFPDVPAALAAAFSLRDRLLEANTYLPEDWDLHACIGIGYGQVLMIPGEDIFGHEMNLASKLGEDVARSEEILITEAARERLSGTNLRLAAEKTEISGMSVTYFRAERAG